MPKSRISIRLDQSLVDALAERCRESEIDTSTIARQAIAEFLQKTAKKAAGSDDEATLTALPPDAHARTAPYLGWGKGDLRKELRRLFVETLAAAHVAAKIYPRTEYLTHVRLKLLALYHLFGVEPDVSQH